MAKKDLKKLANPKAACLHNIKSGKYSTLIPGESLTPINGKFLWHIDEATLTTDMDKYKVIYAFEQAFKAWQPHLDPNVIQATGVKANAQIVIKFKRNGEAELPEPFGPNVLAYAYAPRGTSFGLYADMFFNDEYRWDDMHKPGGYFLFKVAVHEIGHVFNIGHQTTDASDIMYPVYQPNGSVILNADTRKAIYDLYSKYGVQNPTISSDIAPIIKLLYKTKSDISRLNISQVNTLATYLGITFVPSESTQTKLNKIYLKLNQ